MLLSLPIIIYSEAEDEKGTKLLGFFILEKKEAPRFLKRFLTLDQRLISQ